MDDQADTDDLRLEALTASAGAWQISISLASKDLSPDPYVDLTPDDALRLGEWLVERAKMRGAVPQAIEGQKSGF